MKNKLLHFLTILGIMLALNVNSTWAALWSVTTLADNGAGSLRQAILNATSGDEITFNAALAGGTITLESGALSIDKDLTIRGIGISITGESSPIMSIDASMTVSISRIQFIQNADAGIIISASNYSSVSLESCIFMMNQGSAISTYMATLAVKGCTFYANEGYHFGNAMYITGGSFDLVGNLFYSNMAKAGGYIIYNNINAAYTSENNVYNGSSEAWKFTFSETDDKQYGSELPFSPVNFKLAPGSSAIDAITTRPVGYPTIDFYGTTIPANNAQAGAVQEIGTGYPLATGAKGDGSVNFSPLNTEGFYTSGSSVTIEATPNAGKEFYGWVVNGSKSPITTTTLTLTMNSGMDVTACFVEKITITSKDENDLIDVINANNGDLFIQFADNLKGDTIVLTAPLQIDTDLIIEGNGVVLSGNHASSIMAITSEVQINRVHFTKGENMYEGGAIDNSGTLFLQSCIFSYNNVGDKGGAITSWGDLYVNGCTFYMNEANEGGAIFNRGTLTLAGNLFYNNSIVRDGDGGPVTSLGYNFYNVDVDGFSFPSDKGDSLYLSSIPFSPITFKLSISSPALRKITSLPTGYPISDFYGNPIPASNAHAGAVQGGGTGYALSLLTIGDGKIEASGPINADGLYPSGSKVYLFAISGQDMSLGYWMLEGKRISETSNMYELVINENSEVTASFGHLYTVNDASDLPGDAIYVTLRYALNNVTDNDIITFADDLIASATPILLASNLPDIVSDLTIRGNGVSISGDNQFHILWINDPNKTVFIDRVHFTQGNDIDGGAILNSGNLTLQSCIFSNNHVTNWGGAVLNGGILEVTGCTFYNNYTSDNGGAIYSNGLLTTLSGNLFYGNSAMMGGDIFFDNGYGGEFYSLGYNVYSNSPVGMSFISSDVGYGGTMPISTTDFSPQETSLIIATKGSVPETDFYGNQRIYLSAAGAVNYSETVYFTVTFDSQGGSSVESIKAYNSIITKPIDPTRSGYILEGWYNGSIKWNFDTARVFNDVTLKAQWADKVHFSGKVFNTSGQPVPGAQVSVYKLSEVGPKIIATLVETVPVTAGNFDVEVAVSGSYIFYASASGYISGYYAESNPTAEHWESAIGISGYTPSSSVDIMLQPAEAIVPGANPIIIKGNLDYDNTLKARPVAYATVILYGKSKTKSAPDGYPYYITETKTDANGNFSFSVPRDDYAVVIEMAGFTMQSVIQVDATTEAGVNEFTVNYFADETNQLIVGQRTSGSSPESIGARLYPNPVSDFVHIAVTIDGIYVIRIYNSLGQQIVSVNATSRETLVDVTGLKPGIYFVRIEAAGKTETYKLIKR